jgi:hypothetical protein
MICVRKDPVHYLRHELIRLKAHCWESNLQDPQPGTAAPGPVYERQQHVQATAMKVNPMAKTAIALSVDCFRTGGGYDSAVRSPGWPLSMLMGKLLQAKRQALSTSCMKSYS